MLSTIFRCEISRTVRQAGLTCGQPATHFVTYFTDGGAGRYCCTQHLGKAIDRVLDTLPADSYGTAKVTRIGTKRPA